MNKQEFLSWLRGPSESVVSLPSYRRRPLVMGILNVTPDSFSDGGQYNHLDSACKRVDEMIAEGVDLIDIGGASSKPGAEFVSDADELARVLPVITKITQRSDVCLSIDTFHPRVMRTTVDAGVTWINDIMALRMPGALDEVARLGVPVCLMHMQGEPQTMQENPEYPHGLVPSIHAFFKERLRACELHGIQPENRIIDPGFGFGKTVGHNLSLMKGLSGFLRYDCPILLGVSRKSTLGSLLKQGVEHRLAGGLGLAVYAALQGVSIIRTHDVGATKQALDMVDAVVNAVD